MGRKLSYLIHYTQFLTEYHTQKLFFSLPKSKLWDQM
uniref:Uncharacterized protein n=1 Tax=Arundo donax TaxID=35708 RepID=A0A0A8Y9E9_ARUDO